MDPALPPPELPPRRRLGWTEIRDRLSYLTGLGLAIYEVVVVGTIDPSIGFLIAYLIGAPLALGRDEKGKG